MDKMNLLNKLIDIVIEASSLMLTDDFQITEKEGVANIVTSSDIAVQEFLRVRLKELLPDCGFLCEEEDRHDLAHEYIWIVDPIDGTANYARGIRECGICVGLRHNSQMELAVVYLPRTDELFTAERGKGAFVHHPQSGKPSKQLQVSKRPFADGIMCTALSLYHKEHAKVCHDIIFDAYMQCNDVRRFGSAASELCYLALGHYELYFEYMLSPWDFAAASLILEEAGGVLCNLQGRPLDHTKPSGVLAANSKENIDRLLTIVSAKLPLETI